MFKWLDFNKKKNISDGRPLPEDLSLQEFLPLRITLPPENRNKLVISLYISALAFQMQFISSGKISLCIFYFFLYP